MIEFHLAAVQNIWQFLGRGSARLRAFQGWQGLTDCLQALTPLVATGRFRQGRAGRKPLLQNPQGRFFAEACSLLLLDVPKQVAVSKYSTRLDASLDSLSATSLTERGTATKKKILHEANLMQRKHYTPPHISCTATPASIELSLWKKCRSMQLRCSPKCLMWPSSNNKLPGKRGQLI